MLFIFLKKKKNSRMVTTINMDDMNKEAQQVRENGTIYKKVSMD
jgi:hypothetical protein